MPSSSHLRIFFSAHIWTKRRHGMKHLQPVSVSNAAVPALALHTCLVSLLCETAHLVAASSTKASTALFCSCGGAPRAQMKRQTVNEAARMGTDSFYTNCSHPSHFISTGRRSLKMGRLLSLHGQLHTV